MQERLLPKEDRQVPRAKPEVTFGASKGDNFSKGR